MSPTLEGGQYLVVDQVSYFQLDFERLSRIIPFWDASDASPRFAFDPPTRGEIIVFHYPEDRTKDFVKRVVGLPGETIEVRSGTVYVNGEELREPYLRRTDRSSASELVLGEKEYYVIGDNRQPQEQQRFTGLGHRARGEHRRQGVDGLLALGRPAHRRLALSRLVPEKPRRSPFGLKGSWKRQQGRRRPTCAIRKSTKSSPSRAPTAPGPVKRRHRTPPALAFPRPRSTDLGPFCALYNCPSK